MKQIQLDRREMKRIGIRLPKLAKLFAKEETDKEFVFELRVPKARTVCNQ